MGVSRVTPCQPGWGAGTDARRGGRPGGCTWPCCPGSAGCPGLRLLLPAPSLPDGSVIADSFDNPVISLKNLVKFQDQTTAKNRRALTAGWAGRPAARPARWLLTAPGRWERKATPRENALLGGL